MAEEQKDKNKKENERSTKHLLFLAFSALGVVYGDIGTSPLYALRECFHGEQAVDVTPENILGVLSLIFWSLILVISIKYLIVILRADNQGEGGILALMELVLPKRGRKKTVILTVGLFGAALLYGDGAITPAISVLSAIEGLKVATPIFKPYIIPITIAILFFLFLVQYRGTGTVGLMFGPVMIVWFLVLGILGIQSIFQNTEVFAALNPYHALAFFLQHGSQSLFILGAVFLVVTGGEALYADIGHFGRAPIRLTWFTVVLPGLLLNYFGQGALLLRDSSAAENPFYHLSPSWALYPMVFLAACATVIASQAIISGAFSLTFQAFQLGYLPRLKIRHTSEEERGQIFIPQINWMLFVVTVGIVLGFRSSSNLAAAYGVAVSTTMVITTLLGYVAMRELWNWRLPPVILLTGFFLTIDLTFFGANMLKIYEGGWFPILVGTLIYFVMSTWMRGQEVIAKQLKDYTQPIKKFVEELDRRTVKKAPGTAIYLTRSPLSTPPAFVHNLKHNKVLHERVIFMSVGFKNIPYVRSDERVKFEKMQKGIYRVLVRYGFMNRTDISAVVRILREKHIKFDLEETTFFLGRETLIPSKAIGMSVWRDKLYLLLMRNSERATKYFNVPPDRVFEIGSHIKF